MVYGFVALEIDGHPLDAAAGSTEGGVRGMMHAHTPVLLMILGLLTIARIALQVTREEGLLWRT